MSSIDTTTEAVAPMCAEASTAQGLQIRNSTFAIHWLTLSLILAIPSVSFLGFAVGQQLRSFDLSPLWAFGAFDLGLFSLALTRRHYGARIWLRLISLFCTALVVTFFLDVIVYVIRDYVGGHILAWWLIYFG